MKTKGCHLHFRNEPPETPQPKIFIGHGRSSQWRDLKDHLHDQHGYDVVAYEIGTRAGQTIRDILEEMLIQSSFAILLMTGEDVLCQGMRPDDPRTSSPQLKASQPLSPLHSFFLQVQLVVVTREQMTLTNHHIW